MPTTKQIILDRAKEFKKRFVLKCSDGELIPDFKNGHMITPKNIMDFNRKTILLVLNSLREEMPLKEDWILPDDTHYESEYGRGRNNFRKEILDLLSQSIEALSEVNEKNV